MQGITQGPAQAAVVNVKQILSRRREQAFVRRVPQRGVDIIPRRGLATVRNVQPVNTGMGVVVRIVLRGSSRQRERRAVQLVQRLGNTGMGAVVRNAQQGISVPVTDMRADVDRVPILQRERAAVANVVLILIPRVELTAIVKTVLPLLIISQ